MHKVNYEKYTAAWSSLCDAREHLESAQAGLDKILYRKLERLITAIGEIGKELDDQLIRPEQEGK